MTQGIVALSGWQLIPQGRYDGKYFWFLDVNFLKIAVHLEVGDQTLTSRGLGSDPLENLLGTSAGC